MCSFVRQISREDWEISREISICGNREGKRDDETGELRIYRKESSVKERARGKNTIQSISEDLPAMRDGDIVFFHEWKKDLLRGFSESTFEKQERARNNCLKQQDVSSQHFIKPNWGIV